jgi:uncharacterized protein YkwD
MLQKILFVFVAVAAMLSAGSIFAAEKTAEKTGTDAERHAAFASPVLSEEEKVFIDLINAERKRFGLAPLKVDPNLMFGARRWATKHGYHHASHGYNGECISHHSSTGRAAFLSWLASENHYKIMHGSEYRYIGIGFERNRAVLRLSIKPYPYQDTTSVQKSRTRIKLFSRILR